MQLLAASCQILYQARSPLTWSVQGKHHHQAQPASKRHNQTWEFMSLSGMYVNDVDLGQSILKR